MFIFSTFSHNFIIKSLSFTSIFGIIISILLYKLPFEILGNEIINFTNLSSVIIFILSSNFSIPIMKNKISSTESNYLKNLFNLWKSSILNDNLYDNDKEESFDIKISNLFDTIESFIVNAFLSKDNISIVYKFFISGLGVVIINWIYFQ